MSMGGLAESLTCADLREGPQLALAEMFIFCLCSEKIEINVSKNGLLDLVNCVSLKRY